MGEEIQFCAYNYGHNRVAEIWMIQLPTPITKVVQVAAQPSPKQFVTTVKSPTQFVVNRPTTIQQPIVAPTVQTTSIPTAPVTIPVQPTAPVAAPVQPTAPVAAPVQPTPTVAAPVQVNPTTIPQAPAAPQPIVRKEINSVDRLSEFLQQNVTLNDPTKAAEFAEALAALRNLQAAQ